MPANAYPHLVFATDATTLPRTDLESIVTQVFGDREPAPSVEQGPVQAIVHLGVVDTPHDRVAFNLRLIFQREVQRDEGRIGPIQHPSR